MLQYVHVLACSKLHGVYWLSCRAHHPFNHVTSATSPYPKAPPFAALPRPSSPQLDTPRFATLGSKSRQDHYSSPSPLSSSQLRAPNHAEHSQPYRSPAHAARVSAVEQHLRTSLYDHATDRLSRANLWEPHMHQKNPSPDPSWLASNRYESHGDSVHNSPKGLVLVPNSPLGSKLGQQSQYDLGSNSQGGLPSSPWGLGGSQHRSRYGLDAADTARHATPSPLRKPYQGLLDPTRSHGVGQTPYSSTERVNHSHLSHSGLLSHTQKAQLLPELYSPSQRQQPSAELDSLSRRLLEQRLGQGRTAYSGLGSHEALLAGAVEHAERPNLTPPRYPFLFPVQPVSVLGFRHYLG